MKTQKYPLKKISFCAIQVILDKVINIHLHDATLSTNEHNV